MIAVSALEEGLAHLASSQIRLPAAAARQLEAYLELLAKWNRTYNLTAIREPERMVTHHVLDALAILPHLPDRTGLRMIDVGSGGGVPGIPLAIARPEWWVCLLDSNHNKGAFLQQAVMELELRNSETAIVRVQEHVPALPFDVVISRAYSDLMTFAMSAGHLLAPGGVLVAMKGVIPHEELATLPPQFRVVASPAITVPGLAAQRHLVVMERA